MTGNLSLERGLSVLDVLKESDEPIGVRDLGRRLDQSAAAVQRILNTLVEFGYVEQVAESRRYRLGHSVLELARYVLRRDRLIGLAETELHALAGEGCFNAFLAVRRSDRGLYLLTVQSKSPVIIRSSPGETFPLHSTSLGKALLMDLSGEAVIQIVGRGPLERLTPRTVTEPNKLIAEINAAEGVGYTTSIDENFAGLIAIGAPVRDGSGAIVAGISVAYPRSVGPHVEIAEIGEKIMAAAARISVGLGYRSDAGHRNEGASHAAE